MRMACIFLTSDVAFFSLRHYNQALSVWLFKIGQLLIAWPIIAVVLTPLGLQCLSVATLLAGGRLEKFVNQQGSNF